MKEDLLLTRAGRFGIRITGAADAPLVLCLHGFPDDASTFDQLAQALARQGFRVVAPYLRGYAPSPLEGVMDIEAMAGDLLSITEALQPVKPVYFVGHDYGAQIGYGALSQAPNRFQAAVMLAGAHPAAISRNMRRLPRQWWMSRYIVFFQLGKLADHWVARNDFAYVEQIWQSWSPGWKVEGSHLARVKRTLAASMPKPVAMYREGNFDIGEQLIDVPTLLITGGKDGCLLPDLSDGQQRLFASSFERHVWPDVGHFLHLEQPDRTADAVAGWFMSNGC